MLKIIKKHICIELTEDIAAGIRQSLQARYNSLLYRVRLEYINRLGLDSEVCDINKSFKDSPLLLGELYLPEPGTIFYIKAKRGGNLIQAGVITNDENRDTDEFFSEVRDLLATYCDSLPSWRIDEDLLPLEIEDAFVENDPATTEQITAAKALMDRKSRDLLEQIKNAGSIFMKDIAGEERDVVEECIHSFKDLSLVNMDCAVLCRRSGQQILRVSDKSTLNEGPQKAFKCFICGSPISDELTEEVLACTEFGGEMLKDRTWLLVLVRGILAELGVPSSELKIYRSQGLPVQIFLSINGLRYLLVLCTEPLTLDQAYMIGAHITAYRLDSAIIISTEKITTLMKAHLKQTKTDVRFDFIDDINDLNVKLQEVISKQQREHLGALLNDFVGVTKVDIASLVLQRMLPVAETEEEIPAEAVSEVSEIKFESPAEEMPEALDMPDFPSIPNDADIPENSSFAEPVEGPKPDTKSNKKGKKHK
ncbi:hypothetical protein IJT93_05750 [bacterium]|nr:hypothetical protein [bacterium]